MKKRKNIAINNVTAMREANAGRYDLALPQLAEAAMWAQQIEAPLLLAVTKNNMGIALQMAGRHADARTCFQIARETVAPIKPADHPLLIVIDRNMTRLGSEKQAAIVQQRKAA